MKLKNKIALVTGGSSGIGKAIALKFASEGAIVILCARDKDKLLSVEKEIKNNKGLALSIPTDISDRKSVIKLVGNVIRKYKKIDILVNNAGIAIWNSIQDVTYEEFKEHIDINLIGYFSCIKEVIPYMLEKKSGTILNIISGSGKKARAGSIAYVSSKFAQAGLSDAVFEDVNKQGINVTAIYPGKTNTGIHDRYVPKNSDERKKWLKPEDIAELAFYLATLPPRIKIKEVSIRPLV